MHTECDVEIGCDVEIVALHTGGDVDVESGEELGDGDFLRRTVVKISPSY